MQKIKYKKEPTQSAFEKLELLYPEVTKAGKSVRQITFQVTDDCCMACTYCYQHNKAHHSMKFENAKIFIDKLLNNEYPKITTDNTFAVCFSFIGGEPLMEIKLIQQIWEYLIQQLIIKQHPWLNYITWDICSNGLLYFEEDVQNFIQKYYRMGNITFSIDGNKQLHDSCRFDLEGKGTYDRAVMAMQNYSKLSGQVPQTKMTLSPDNIVYTKEAVINLINLGYKDIFLNCIFEEGWNENHATVLYYQLKELSNYLIDNKLYDKIYISMLNEDLFTPLSSNENQNYCGGTIDGGLAIDWKGDFFPCLRYMESSLNGKQKPLNMGNIFHGIGVTQEENNNISLLSNITRRSQSTDKCFYCPIAKGCSWCSAFCYECNGTPNKRTTFNCIMHQAQALGNCYYWNTLYKKLKINKIFINNVPEDWALQIISEQEWSELNYV